MTLADLIPILSDALGIDVRPYADVLVDDGMLAGFDFEASPWEAAILLGATAATRDPTRSADVVVELAGLSLATAIRVDPAGSTDITDILDADPIELMAAIISPDARYTVFAFTVWDGGSHLSLTLDGQPAIFVGYGADGVPRTKLRRTTNIGGDVFEQLRAAFGPATATPRIATTVETAGPWGVTYPTSASVH